jgi:hypothetical protein
MPRRTALKKRSSFNNFHRLDNWLLVALVRGFFFPPWLWRYGKSGEKNREELKEVWCQFRDEILTLHIKQFPATRPWAWWEFDAPELRKVVSGSIEVFDAIGRRSKFGILNYGIHSNNPPVFESEWDYLKGHGQLTDKEIKLNAKSQFMGWRRQIKSLERFPEEFRTGNIVLKQTGNI